MDFIILNFYEILPDFQNTSATSLHQSRIYIVDCIMGLSHSITLVTFSNQIQSILIIIFHISWQLSTTWPQPQFKFLKAIMQLDT